MSYTKFPNWLLDRVCEFDPLEWKILCCIVRLTNGDASQKITIDQITELSQGERQTVDGVCILLAFHGVIVWQGSKFVKLKDL